MLKVGDTINRMSDDMIKYMTELAKEDIETDFLHTGGRKVLY